MVFQDLKLNSRDTLFVCGAFNGSRATQARIRKKSVKGYNSRFINVSSVIYNGFASQITIASSTRQPKSASKNSASFFHLFAVKTDTEKQALLHTLLMMGEIFRTAAVKTTRFHEIAIALSRSQRTQVVSLSSLLKSRVDIKGEILLRHNMSEIIPSRFMRLIELHFDFRSHESPFPLFPRWLPDTNRISDLRFCHFFMQTLTEWYRKFKCVQPSGSPPSLRFTWSSLIPSPTAERESHTQHVVSIGFAIISGVVV